MVSNFHLPPTGFGPGSQPPAEDGEELAYLEMPQDMRAYSAHIPDAHLSDETRPAFDLMRAVADAALASGKGAGNASFDLSGLNEVSRRLISETLGEGEVSMRIHSTPALAAQESVFAGVWTLRGADLDQIEVGPVPSAARTASSARRRAVGALAPTRPGVLSAPPIAVELLDRSATWTPDHETHVVNLTLLPHSEEDLAWLDEALGQGAVDILSRGYGNCRIEATGVAHVWRVRFYNSMDTLILDTFEVTDMPAVALAAPEDLTDSAERIFEVLEAME